MAPVTSSVPYGDGEIVTYHVANPPVTDADLSELGFTPGRSGINWTHGIYLSVTLYRDGVIDVRVEDVPLYGVRTRADVEAMIRLLGEPRS